MENRINVTVEYETPTTNKFDALMKQYNKAKQIADETEKYNTPLIEGAGLAKYKAIIEQLKPIIRQVEQIALLTNSMRCEIMASYNFSDYLVIECNRGDTEVRYGKYAHGKDFLNWEVNKEELISVDGLITNWNKHGIIGKLQNRCEYYMASLIKEQEQRAQKSNSNLAVMLG